MNCLVLYCRIGFEGECAAEIMERAAALETAGYCKAVPGSGYVVFTPHEAGMMSILAQRLSWHELTFARQMFASPGLVEGLPPADRLTPLLAALDPAPVSEVFVETADTNEAKELLALCRKLATPLTVELRKRGLLREGNEQLPRLHVFFLGSDRAYPGLAARDNSSPWFMGIPRLKFPRGAPSRSTLKLEEALLTFLGEREREQRLRPGMRAVDLGASPGGWTWQLVRRHMHVTAVDNGPMDAALLDSGLVEHLRLDGFRYRPARPVDWMVCDMVEQPIRIAALVAQWLANGWCRETIFNLKLPMKKRFQETERCRAAIHEAIDPSGMRYTLAFKQLYHDREEVTGHARRLD